MDLDNTLVDREQAFHTWAQHFISEITADPADLDWLLASDDDGYTPRAELAIALKERWGLDTGVPDLVARLLFDHVQFIETYTGVPAALEALGAAGVVLVVVTNGIVAQQERKLQRTGLAALITDSVISEAVGSKKPDPRIFRTALEAAGRHGGRGPAWMIGDHPMADIAGARNCGLLTGWVSHHRAWSTGAPADIACPRTVDVLRQIIAAPPGRGAP
ncbi:HAD family hydrolase [Blastococcus goldschmidtiae]|uniref:HAD family hydrolase n=1 Tax=Blastococcus goldschmidtiae TaxID=3075546 RepID=A0ABU2K4X2_9ACTN|nr:HAD family hydrolase [Blastococcus sp. DSM 46792]MDT0275256.1 HAD family hydrolase [Blastococcus sp. DSM 46792]